MRSASAQASSRLRVWISAPRAPSEASITSRRGNVGSSLPMLASTASRYSFEGESRIDCATSSCSAWEKRSIATQSAGVEPSPITRISQGPAIMSMPTWPNTWRLAAATYALPGPTILSTRGTDAVP